MEIQMTDKNGIRLLTENKMVKENIEIIPVFDELEIVQTPGSSTTAVMSQKASSNLFANSLKGNAQGAMVSMDDVAQDSIAVANLRSKNLIPYPYYSNATTSLHGVTITINEDNSITFEGTATDKIYYFLAGGSSGKFKLPFGDYTFSNSIIGTGVGLHLETYKKGAYQQGIGIGSDVQVRTINLSKEYDNLVISAVIESGKTVDCTIYPQLEYGTVATPYTPYVPNDKAVTVKSCGKNLLDDSTVTANNLVTTDEYGGGLVIDGHSFTAKGVEGGVNGANAGQFMLPYASVDNIKERGIKTIPNKQYAVSFDVLIKEYGANGSQIACIVYHITKGILQSLYTEKVTGLEVGVSKHISFSFVAPNNSESDRIGLTFRLNNQYLTISNVMVVPVEYGTTATAYEPYIEGETIETYIHNDINALSPIAPNMTITTDNSGVILDVDYKRDTNIAYEKLEKRLIALETAIVNG